MSKDQIIPVVLSGGAGTRLWPLSRQLYPKQLLPLVTDNTMLQDTILRVAGIAQCANPIIVCNEHHRFLVAEQLREAYITPGALILEPDGRNTAPAAAVAAYVASRQGDDPVLLLLPADHSIRDNAAFVAAIDHAVSAAKEGRLVTFGVVPDRAETGYGYIRSVNGNAVRDVAEFVEKPDAMTAQTYLDSGEYYWNSGMFVFKASVYLAAIEKFAPEILQACKQAVDTAESDLDFLRLDSDAFQSCPSDSIDYAVMEKTDKAAVVPLDAGWSDVGSWESLHAALDHDENDNTTHGDVLSVDTKNCYLYASSRLVATVGLKDHVVVETKDAVLVAPRDKAQDVKKIAGQLAEQGRYESELGRQVFRPWGSYDSIDAGDRFQVKRLIVNPGAVLSLQMHHHRAEHWVVVSGSAKITRGDEEFLLEENQSTYIPVGTKHRIENPGMVPCHIIEVQSGSYLGEDDIVRFEDNYGRKGRTD